MKFFKRDTAAHGAPTTGGVTVLSGATQALVPTGPAAPHLHATSLVAAAASNGGDEIRTVDDLPQFVRPLYDDLRMSPSLRHEICPVLVSEPKSAGGTERGEYALILTREMLSSDFTEEIQRQLRMRYDAAAKCLYVAAAQVMVTLSRGSFDSSGGREEIVGAMGRRSGSALWQNFESAIRFALTENASDLHWEAVDHGGMSQIRFAIDGHLVAPPEFRMETGVLLDTLAHVWQKGKGGSQGVFSRVLPQQTSIRARVDDQAVVLRWASMQSATGHVTVMRMHREEVEDKSVDFVTDLGYFPSQAEIIYRTTLQQGGGTVFVGVVGSGKTTSAHAVMQKLPDWMHKMAVEDPVELLARGTHHFSVARTLDGANRDEDPFIAVKRQIKRMNPHFVMIGELRDHESAGLFRDVAGAGLRAMTTVHAPGALQAPDRLSDGELQIPRSVLATPGFVNLYVYQALIPKTCSCGHRGDAMKQILGAEKLRQIERLFQFDIDGMRVRNMEGCPLCRRPNLPMLNGIRGRTVAAEMFEPDEQDLAYIRDARNLELAAYQRSKRVLGFDQPDSTGKSCFEVAMYNVFTGVVDPREAERLSSMDAYEAKLARRKMRHDGVSQ
ncbi:ATPase, T2SS/T4P/T4SS family [Cupriavidus sp. WS]|uniref:ATPase, T2SS/T4P/T4SS family n=1 Tax=Cupriavidus sp. WS TaxID=1312922 RepID=UPI00048FD1E4|nr:ATPase, T2SS/T4P/T4SS family [Cupriavidus sp. WS]